MRLADAEGAICGEDGRGCGRDKGIPETQPRIVAIRLNCRRGGN